LLYVGLSFTHFITAYNFLFWGKEDGIIIIFWLLQKKIKMQRTEVQCETDEITRGKYKSDQQ